jgi:hypothetical protein
LAENIAESRAAALLLFSLQFRTALDDIGARAFSSLSRLTSAAALYSMYTSKEIVAAADAAQAVGMTPEQGVAALAHITEALAKAGQKRTPFGRLASMFAPREGTLAFYNRLMSDHTLGILKVVDPVKTRLFTDKYFEVFERISRES